VPRFFVPRDHISAGRAVIRGDDALHLASALRINRGEEIVVVDDTLIEHGVAVDTVSPHQVEGRVMWSRPATGEPATAVHVIQALPKVAMDDVVEALAEVGAAAVWPVVTRRTISRPDGRRAAARLARWQAVAREAAGLSGRAAPPHIHPLMTLDEAIASLPSGSRRLVCTPDAGAPLSAADLGNGDAVALFVGPEGGFDAEERTSLAAAGALAVHLGPRVLRARRAAAIATALVLLRAGEMDRAAAPPPQTVPV
jgi:16S rRNA (uracil1498-N3)-methyltransferase